MFGLIRRALRVLRYRRRWRALAASAQARADDATALHERRTQGQDARPFRRADRRRPF